MYSARNPLTIMPIDHQKSNWETLEETKVYHLLKLCIYWECNTVVKEIIRAIDSGKKLHPVFKIAFALEPFDSRMSHWIRPAHDELVSRARSLSREEIDLIGSQRAAVICEFREKRFDLELLQARNNNPNGYRYPQSTKSEDSDRWFYTQQFDRSTYGVPELRVRPYLNT